MKKIFITFICLGLILTGCSQDSAYQQLTSELKPLASKDGINIVFGSTISNSDSELDGTAYEINYAFNLKDDLFKADIDGIEMYFKDDIVYMNLFETWFKDQYVVENYGNVQSADKFKDFITNLPRGTQKLGANATGNTYIDNLIQDKTLDELVVSTGENTYSLAGLEDSLKISTVDNLRIDFTSEQTGTIYMILTPGSSITLPAEAETAIDLEENGGISSLI